MRRGLKFAPRPPFLSNPLGAIRRFPDEEGTEIISIGRPTRAHIADQKIPR